MKQKRIILFSTTSISAVILAITTYSGCKNNELLRASNLSLKKTNDSLAVITINQTASLQLNRVQLINDSISIAGYQNCVNQVQTESEKILGIIRAVKGR